MIKNIIIKKLEKFSDARGWLIEIFRKDEIDYQPAMSYVSVTSTGKTRGPHEHVQQADLFVFIGPGTFKLYLWDNRKNSPTYQEKMELEGGEDNPIYIIVPPGIVHGYKCISKKPAWCINLPNKLYKGNNKAEEIDEIRWEDKADSPFQID